MNDDLLRQADPFEAVRADGLAVPDLDLFDELVAMPDADLGRLRSRKQRTLTSRLIRAGVAAAAVTGLIAGTALIANGPDRGTPQAAEEPGGSAGLQYAAMVRVAQANPRILVTAPGWKVRSLEGFNPDSGGMTFQLGPDRWVDKTYGATEDNALVGEHTNVAPRLVVSWYPSDQYDGYLSDRAQQSGLQHVSVLGHRSQMISYSATDHAVMLPPQGAVFIEIRGSVGDEAAFKAFLADNLKQVDVSTWLAAMPDSIVTPDVAAGQAGTMLKGIPLPPGFDQAALADGVAQDQYQFGAKVTGAVACGWLDEWTRASAAGDEAAKARAVDALVGSRDWKVLNDMNAEGDYPEVLWEYADLVAGGQAPAGYKSALGCD